MHAERGHATAPLSQRFGITGRVHVALPLLRDYGTSTALKSAVRNYADRRMPRQQHRNSFCIGRVGPNHTLALAAVALPVLLFATCCSPYRSLGPHTALTHAHAGHAGHGGHRGHHWHHWNHAHAAHAAQACRQAGRTPQAGRGAAQHTGKQCQAVGSFDATSWCCLSIGPDFARLSFIWPRSSLGLFVVCL